jgi:hypothetical protein
MFNYKERQYIFKQSSGRIWNFFLDSNHRLYCCSLGKRNSWSEPFPIYKETVIEFSVDIDDSDIFHIVFQNSLGNILYLIFDCKNNQKSLKGPIILLENKKHEVYHKYITTLVTKTALHIFFIINHEGKKVLSHQLVREGIPMNPAAISIVSAEPEIPYFCIETNSSLHVFFYKCDKLPGIYYSKYIEISNNWAEKLQIPYTDKITSFFLTKSTDNFIHIIITKPADSNTSDNSVSNAFNLHYSQKPHDRPEWSSFTDICTHYSDDKAGIITSEGKPLIFMCGNNGIYEFTTNDNGLSWSKQNKYPFNYGRHIICVTYKSNQQSEKSIFHGQFLPAAFVNGIKLAFYKEPTTLNPSPAPADLRDIILESLALMKEELDLLNERQQSLESDYSKLSRLSAHIEKSFEKLEIRLKYLEKNFNIKSL